MESDEASFVRWAADRQVALLRTAILLTGDHHRAEDLVQEALTKVALRWRRLRGGNPEAYARQVLVRDNISGWRKRRREVVSAEPGDAPSPDLAVASDRRMLLDPQYQLYRPTGERAAKSYEPDLYFGPRPGDQRYGPLRIGTDRIANVRLPALSFHLAGPVPTPDGGETETVEALVAAGPDGESLLATPTGRERWLEGMPVAGWLDPTTVLFESRWAEAKVLAWRVGTGEVHRVSDFVGWTPGVESYVASFADLSAG